jgi:hypothetical protein
MTTALRLLAVEQFGESDREEVLPSGRTVLRYEKFTVFSREGGKDDEGSSPAALPTGGHLRPLPPPQCSPNWAPPTGAPIAVGVPVNAGAAPSTPA